MTGYDPNEIISKLEAKYADDAEAMEVINDAKKDISYIETQMEKGAYSGQTPTEKILEVEGVLEIWYPVMKDKTERHMSEITKKKN